MYPWPIVPPSCGIVESFKTLFFVFFLRGGGRVGGGDGPRWGPGPSLGFLVIIYV